MKKTLMAGIVALCAMSGMNAAQAAAAISGTQTFKANITDSTCTIANVNRTVDLGEIPRNRAVANGMTIVPDIPFNITGCGASISAVSVTADYAVDKDASAIAGMAMMKNFGTARLQAVLGITTKGVINAGGIGGYAASGKKIINRVVNGASHFNFSVYVLASNHLLSNLSSGSVEYPVTLTFDFT